MGARQWVVQCKRANKAQIPHTREIRPDLELSPLSSPISLLYCDGGDCDMNLTNETLKRALAGLGCVV